MKEPSAIEDSNQVVISPKKSRNYKRFILLFFGFVLFSAVAAAIVIRLTASPEPVFTIGTKEYSQQNINELIAYKIDIEKVSRDTATRDLYDMLQLKAAAEKLNINFGVNELKDHQKQQSYSKHTNSEYSKYLNLKAFNELLDQYLYGELQTINSGHYKGYAYIFHFSEAITNAPAYKSPYYGNTTYYERDKKYADERAKYFLQALRDKELSADEVLEQVRKDTKLGLYNKPNTNDSAKFGYKVTENWQQAVFYRPIIDYVKLQAEPNLSEIRTGQVATVPNPITPADYKDGYYYFVLLTEAERNASSINNQFQNAVKQVKASSKYNGYKNND